MNTVTQIRLYFLATTIAVLISACAYFEKPTVPSDKRLIDRQAFINQRLQGKPQAPTLPALLPLQRQRRINLLSASPLPESDAIASSPISLRLTDVPLRIFAAMLSDLIGYNILIAPDINGVVNHDLNRVGWREALYAIAELQGLTVDEQSDKRLIRLYKSNPDRNTSSAAINNRMQTERSVELFKLRYADADKIATLLKSLLGERQPQGGDSSRSASIRSSVIGDNSSHSLIVQGDKQTIELAASLIGTIDVPQRQVMIEAFIVEAGEDFTRALGARLGKHRDGLFRTENINGPYLNVPVSGAGGGLGLTFGSARIRVELSALEKAGKSRLISNPKIFTLDNQSAMIFEGSEVPYQTVSDSGTQTEFKQAGLKLAVTPNIVNEQHLILDLEINKDTVDTRLQNPPITRRELTSRLLVRSGDVVVIGGIYLNQQVRAFEGMPFITHLPLIGNWFQHKRREGDVKELMVFIAPQIV